MDSTQYDVVVIGKGNAALCAALSAKDQGASVIVLEAASEDESGGNSRFAGGVMRFAYETVDDLKRVTDLTDEEVANSDFGTNTKEEYFDDLVRLTQFRTDPELSETLVTQSLDVMAWLRGKGARFVPNFGRQSGMVNGKRKFFGRLPIEVSGGGAGLVRKRAGTVVDVEAIARAAAGSAKVPAARTIDAQKARKGVARGGHRTVAGARALRPRKVEPSRARVPGRGQVQVK